MQWMEKLAGVKIFSFRNLILIVQTEGLNTMIEIHITRHSLLLWIFTNTKKKLCSMQDNVMLKKDDTLIWAKWIEKW